MIRIRTPLLVAAVGVLFVSFLLLISGNWHLACTDMTGTPLQGIDCLQYDAVPKADSAPARWFGFPALIIAFMVSAAIAVGFGLRFLLIRGRAGGGVI